MYILFLLNKDPENPKIVQAKCTKLILDPNDVNIFAYEDESDMTHYQEPVTIDQYHVYGISDRSYPTTYRQISLREYYGDTI